MQASDSPPKTLAGLAESLKSTAILARGSSVRAGLVQLFIANQTYGNKRYKESVDQDMRRLLLQYRHYPVYLVCCWMAVQTWKHLVPQHVDRSDPLLCSCQVTTTPTWPGAAPA